MGTDSQRSHKRNVPPRELANREVVEVIVVVMRNDDEVDWWHAAQANRVRLEAFRSRKPRRRRTPSPDGVRQNFQAFDFDQECRVSKPGRAQTASRLFAP